ncbi:uncharacterized protein TNCV_4372211 [Trichonephila clavipes]|nr:uncharacterized protein TNCV_4372211 [Trichonephila clavipes]
MKHSRRSSTLYASEPLSGSKRKTPLFTRLTVFKQGCNPAKCEVRSVIRFLHAKGQRPAEIHQDIVSVYGNIMNRQNVTKWCRHFSEGRTDVHDEQRTGRPSVISDALLQRTEEAIRVNRRLKLKELHQIIPEVSMTTLFMKL